MKLIVLMAGVVVIVGSGCAQRTLDISSEPSGALVYLNGEEVGRTPMRVDIDDYGDYDVVLRKEGYQTLKTHQRLKTPLHMLPPFDLVSEMLGVRDKRAWTFTMAAQEAQAADAEELVARGILIQGELRSSQYTRPPTTFPTTRPAER